MHPPPWNGTVTRYAQIAGEQFCGVMTGLERCYRGRSVPLRFFSDDYAPDADKYRGFELLLTVSSGDQCTCLTEAGDACVFPFVFYGLTFHQCTRGLTLNLPPFCATIVDENGQFRFLANCSSNGNNHLRSTHCLHPASNFHRCTCAKIGKPNGFYFGYTCIYVG